MNGRIAPCHDSRRNYDGTVTVWANFLLFADCHELGNRTEDDCGLMHAGCVHVVA